MSIFETSEGFLAPADISPEPVDGLQKFKLRLEAIEIMHSLYRTDFYIFVFVSLIFCLNFSLILIKTSKSFVFEFLFIGDYSLTFYLFDDNV